MKKIYTLLYSLLLGLAVVSCSSEEEAPLPAPSFPESQTLEIQPEQVKEIGFEADREWRVSTDRQWLKFIDASEARFQSLTGKAGKQTVKVTVTDGAMGFEEDVAKVQLSMGGQTQTIAKLKRGPKERVVKMYTYESNEPVQIDEFKDLPFGRSRYLGFEANFDWRVDMASVPSWLVDELGSNGSTGIANLCGEAGQLVSFGRMAGIEVDVAARYEDLSGYITVKALDSDYTCQFPVSAPGIESGKIQWVGNSVTLRGGFLWDDKGVRLNKAQGGEITELEEPVVCHVVIRDNAYTCHFVEWNSMEREAQEVSVEDSWVSVAEQDGGKVTLQAKENMVRASRKMYVFFVPKGTVIDYNTQFSRSGNFTFDSNGYGIQLEQYGLSGGFSAWKQINTMKYEEMVNVNKVVNASEIISKLNLTKTDNIYERSFTAEEWNMTNKIHITPLGLETQPYWQFELFNSKFESLGFKPAGWSSSNNWTFGSVLDENYAGTRSLVLDARNTFNTITEDCLYIVIRDQQGKKDLGTFVIRKK